MQTVSRLLEITFLLIVLYIVVANARAFSTIVSTLGATYTSSVRALQGK